MEVHSFTINTGFYEKIIETYSKELLELLSEECRQQGLQYDIVPSEKEKSKFMFLVEEKGLHLSHNYLRSLLKNRDYISEDRNLGKYLSKQRKKTIRNEGKSVLRRFLMFFKDK